jgi:hypothetical protein
MDLAPPEPRAQFSKLGNVPALSQRTSGRAKIFDHYTNSARSSRANTQNPNQELRRETSEDNYVLELRNRHRRSKVRQEEPAQGNPQGAVQKKVAGNRTSGTAGNEGQIASRLHGHSLLRNLLHAPEQLRNRQPECLRNLFNIDQRHVPLAAFDPTDVSSIHLTHIRKGFLGHP